LQAWVSWKNRQRNKPLTITFLGGYLTFFKKKNLRSMIVYQNCLCIIRLLRAVMWWWSSAVQDHRLKVFDAVSLNNPPPKTTKLVRRSWYTRRRSSNPLVFYTCVIYILLCLGFMITSASLTHPPSWWWVEVQWCGRFSFKMQA